VLDLGAEMLFLEIHFLKTGRCEKIENGWKIVVFANHFVPNMSGIEVVWNAVDELTEKLLAEKVHGFKNVVRQLVLRHTVVII